MTARLPPLMKPPTVGGSARVGVGSSPAFVHAHRSNRVRQRSGWDGGGSKAPTVYSSADDVIGQSLKKHSDALAINAVTDLSPLSFTLRKIGFDDSDLLERHKVLAGSDSLRSDRTDDLRNTRVGVARKPLDDVDPCSDANHFVSVSHDGRQRMNVMDGGRHRNILPDG